MLSRRPGVKMPEINQSRSDARVTVAIKTAGPSIFLPCTGKPDSEDFGLSDESPLPPVREDTLATYHEYLANHLSLPFDALCCENGVRCVNWSIISRSWN